MNSNSPVDVLDFNYIHFLGRGSAFNTKEGNTSAFYKYNNNKSMILIDCGLDVYGRLIELKLLDSVKDLYVLITHHHSDHIGSLGALIEYCYYVMKLKLNIYHSDSITFYHIMRFLESVNVTQDMYEVVYSHPMVIGTSIVKHCPNVNNTMFIIKNECDKSIIYTGDTCDIAAVKFVHTLNPSSLVCIDCCNLEYENNPHMSIDTLINNIDEEVRHNFVCMHFDSGEAIRKARENGFSIATRTNMVKLKAIKSLSGEWISDKQFDLSSNVYVRLEMLNVGYNYLVWDITMNFIGRFPMTDLILQI
jgi:hypothetical protein